MEFPMNRMILIFVLVALAAPAVAEEPVDLEAINRIRYEGFENSQVMDIAAHLTNVIGARITGSPAMTRANEWTRDQLTGFGLENARLEAYAFGRGWDWQSCRVDLLGETPKSLSAIPQAWTPGTSGPVRGGVIRIEAETAEELEEFEGDVSGKFVLVSPVREVEPTEDPSFRRRDDEGLMDLCGFEIPGERSGPTWTERSKKLFGFRAALDDWLHERGGLGIIDHSSRDHGILRVPRGAQPDDVETRKLPAITMATEQYNRLVRLVEDGEAVELEVEIESQFHGDRDAEAFNTLAEIPGRSRKDEVVMVGAHLDSYHAGTGATDNAAGCAVMMEAVRILQAIDARPERTIRIALWSGEEQGLLGSEAWVRDHLASRPAPTDSTMLAGPRTYWNWEGPLTLGDEHERVSVYFNFDNGGGRIRGIHTEGNVAVVPLFERWFGPFADVGVSTVSTNDTGGTDHMSFDAVGVPGFQFIQDQLDYWPRTHHTHLDTYDHLVREDLMQAAVVVASLALHAANRENLLPRKPVDAN
jgi:hypothetical protein